MELDCEDQVDGQPYLGMSTQHDIFKMLTAISLQMMQNYQDIQDRLDNTELRLSQEITRISQEHDDFKRDTTSVLQALSQGPPSISGPASNGNQDVPISASVPSIPTHSPVSPSTPCPSTVLSNSAPSAIAASTSVDFQVQMMTMLNETFNKLSTVLSDKGTDMKGDWPKFSGDSEKFRSWYLAILAQLSIPPWLDLYNASTNDVVPTTTNTILNGKLYAKILVCLESQVLQNMVSRKHVRGNGLLLLKELVQTYKPRNVDNLTDADEPITFCLPWDLSSRASRIIIALVYCHLNGRRRTGLLF